jgi:hypothetical protein
MQFAFDVLFVLCLVAPPAAIVIGIVLLAIPRQGLFHVRHVRHTVGA